MSFANDSKSTEAGRPAVVLLHSSASSARQWERLAAMLQPRFEVHALDLHGHGAQPEWRAARPLTLADEAALVAPVLARARGAHVVGHSYGAAVALRLATQYPALVRSVVSYEPVLFGLLFGDVAGRLPLYQCLIVADAVRGHLARGETLAAARRFVTYWSGNSAWETMPEARKDAVAARMRSVARHFDAVFAERPHLPGSHLPMLFLTGANTVDSTRRIGERLREGLARARHETLPAMGHMGPITHADAVNARIAAFLQETESPRPRRDDALTRRHDDCVPA